MEGLESAYNRKEKHEKSMCKHCKSEAHSTLQHAKHYKGFKQETKDKLEMKHMKPFENKPSVDAEGPHLKRKAFEGTPRDDDRGVKEGSKEDRKRDREEMKHEKGMPKTYDGKSTKLGHGGRAAKLRDEGVPGAVIGAIARSKGAAPGGPNYHGKHKKAAPNVGDQPSMANWRPVKGGFNYPQAPASKGGGMANRGSSQYDGGHAVMPDRSSGGNVSNRTTPMNNAAMGSNLNNIKNKKAKKA